MDRTPLRSTNRKRRSVDAIDKDEIDSLADWKNGFIVTPKRPSLSKDESSNAFSTSVATTTPAPLATLDEDECENKSHDETDKFNQSVTPDFNLNTPKPRKCKVRRSFSAPLANKSCEPSTPEFFADCDGFLDRIKSVSVQCLNEKASSSSSSPVSKNLYEEKVLRRPHTFINKSVYVKFTCGICHDASHFGLNAKKCQDCKLICHDNCCSKAPIPCIAWIETHKPKDGRLRLGEYSADVRPKLPSVIRHCVRFLNSDTMVTGLYTKNIYDNEASALLRHLIDKKTPPLFNAYGSRGTSQCIIKFLECIREPLIPMSSNDEFYEASLTNDNEKLKNAINDLPTVHKNTLAYLFMHWQLLNKFSKVNGLTPEILATALIPIIMRGFKECGPQEYKHIFINLLRLPTLFWQKIIEDDCKPPLNTPTLIARNSSKKAKLALSRSITVCKLQQDSIKRNPS